MRMTLNLDSDVYSFAQAYAGGRGISLSAAIGELVRQAEHASAVQKSDRLLENEHGFLEIVKTGHPITPDMVRATLEDQPA